MSEGSWFEVMALDDLEEELPEGREVAGVYLAFYRIGDRAYATAGYCSHAKAKLCDGYVEDDEVECPLHQARFHIPTGKVLCAPANQDIAVYPVEIREGRVFVRLAKKS